MLLGHRQPLPRGIVDAQPPLLHGWPGCPKPGALVLSTGLQTRSSIIASADGSSSSVLEILIHNPPQLLQASPPENKASLYAMSLRSLYVGPSTLCPIGRRRNWSLEKPHPKSSFCWIDCRFSLGSPPMPSGSSGEVCAAGVLVRAAPSAGSKLLSSLYRSMLSNFPILS